MLELGDAPIADRAWDICEKLKQPPPADDDDGFRRRYSSCCRAIDAAGRPGIAPAALAKPLGAAATLRVGPIQDLTPLGILRVISVAQSSRTNASSVFMTPDAALARSSSPTTCAALPGHPMSHWRSQHTQIAAA
jgi:hypothetical protein